MRIFRARVLSHTVGASFRETLGKIFLKTLINTLYEKTIKIHLLPSESVKLNVIYLLYVFSGMISKLTVFVNYQFFTYYFFIY